MALRVLLIPTVLLAASCADDPGRVASRFFSSLEATDMEAVHSLLADDFRLLDGAGNAVASREEMATLLGWDFEAAPEIRLGEMQVAGDTVRVRVVERNDFTRLLDLDPWVSDVRLIVRDGKIVEETLREPDDVERSFGASFGEAVTEVLAWGERHRPGLHATITRSGGLQFDAPTARALLDLIRAYRERPGGGQEGGG